MCSKYFLRLLYNLADLFSSIYPKEPIAGTAAKGKILKPGLQVWNLRHVQRKIQVL